MVVTCPSCGKTTEAESGACAHCSAPILPAKKSNTGLIVGIVVCCALCLCIVPIGAAIVLPLFMNIHGVSGERTAVSSLRSVTNAEENFRANDLDRNAVADYWTANMAGLYCVEVKATGTPIAALSDIGVASADLDPRNEEALKFDGADAAYDPSLLLASSPKAGYAYQALIRDADGRPYAQDTDQSGVKARNTARFGFMSIPVAHADTGLNTFVVDESAVIYQRDFGSNTRVVIFGERLDTFDGAAPLDYPKDAAAAWRKAD